MRPMTGGSDDMKRSAQIVWLISSTLVGSEAAAQTIDLAAPTARQIVSGSQAGGRAGTWLDVGDVSGDIHNKDLILGMPDFASSRGEVRILFGWVPERGDFSLDGAQVVIAGESAGDRFGYRTNAGFVTTRETRPESQSRDLLVGAPGALGGRGEVYLFAGPLQSGVTLTTGDAVFRILGAPGDQLGSAVETADLNGDGFREIIVGAPGNNRVYVIDYHNAGSSTRDLATQAATQTITGTGIGHVLAAGDLTGDMRFDVMIGAPTVNNGAGAVYVLYGSGSLAPTVTLPGGAQATFHGLDAGDNAGSSLWIKEDGDFDGDGVWDLLIAAHDADGPGNSRVGAGEVYVIFGRAGLPSTLTADATFVGAAAGHRLGWRLRSGDITRDDADDIALLARGANGNAGEGFVFYGRPRGQFPASIDLASSFDRRIISDETIGGVETLVVWEVTGEGAEDVALGVPSADSGMGRIYLTISPTLTPEAQGGATTGGEELTVNILVNPGQTWTVPIWLKNNTTIPITWEVTSDTSWLNAAPSAGTSVSTQDGLFHVTASAGNHPQGTYVGTLRVFSTSRHLESSFLILVRMTVTASPRDAADFSGDGMLDLVWQHQTEGLVALWRMNGTVLMGGEQFNPGRVADTNWKIVGTGDFNRDGHPDLLWHHQTEGWLGIWAMNGANLVMGLSLIPDQVGDPNWRIAATGDFNGDGHRDIIWHHRTEGRISAWLMNGTRLASGVELSPGRVADVNWRIAGAADFNADGRTDLVWHHQETGKLAIWFMDGVRLMSGVPVNPDTVADTNWQIRAVGDINRDGRPDLLWQHETSGQIAAWFMNGATLMSGGSLVPGTVADLNWKIVGPR